MPVPALMIPRAPPVSLRTPPIVRSPPLADVVKVRSALKIIARLIVWRFVLLLVTSPPSVILLPPSVKAPAPELKVMPAKLVSAVRSLLGVVRLLPAKDKLSFATGAPARLQLPNAPPLLQLSLKRLPPLHVRLAPKTAPLVRMKRTNITARTRGIPQTAPTRPRVRPVRPAVAKGGTTLSLRAVPVP